MPTHDCSKCKVSGECPIEDIAPWLNEHENEVQEAATDQKLKLAEVCAGVSMHNPIMLLCASDLAHAVTLVFYLGYHKGRTYQDVPEVFKNA